MLDRYYIAPVDEDNRVAVVPTPPLHSEVIFLTSGILSRGFLSRVTVLFFWPSKRLFASFCLFLPMSTMLLLLMIGAQGFHEALQMLDRYLNIAPVDEDNRVAVVPNAFRRHLSYIWNLVREFLSRVAVLPCHCALLLAFKKAVCIFLSFSSIDAII
jgi:hypothetical protein